MARDSGEEPLKVAYHKFSGLNTQFANLEPKKSNRFVVYIESIPTHGVQSSQNTERSTYSLLLSLESFKRPSYQNETKAIDHFNEKIYFAGKDSTSKEVSCTFYDYIGSTENKETQTNNSSPASALYRWWMTMHDLDYGSIGYKKYYATDIYLYLLAPNGFVIETWKYYSCMPSAMDFGDVKYSSSENLKINVTFKYDKCKMIAQNVINDETKDSKGNVVKKSYLDSVFQNSNNMDVNSLSRKESLDK